MKTYQKLLPLTITPLLLHSAAIADLNNEPSTNAPFALTQSTYLFDVKANTRLLLEQAKGVVISKDKLQGVLIYDTDPETARFVYKENQTLAVLDADFTYAPHANNEKEKRYYLAQGVATAQFSADGFLNSVLLGSFRYQETALGSKMAITLTGTGINTDDDIYGTLQLRYNQKNSQIVNNNEENLAAVIAKKFKLNIQDVEDVLAKDTDGDGMPDWFENEYRGEIMFEDHFDDGNLDPAWVMKRTYWEETDGKLKSVPEVLPNFNYGHWGNGRGALIVLHEGDTNWVDYSYEYVCVAEGVSSDLNPHFLPVGYISTIGSSFRALECPESWNEPARTQYSFSMGLGDGAEEDWNFSGGSGVYIPGTGWSSSHEGEGTTFTNGNSSAINTGSQTNHVRILVKDNHMYAWVNGTFLGKSVDPLNWAPYGGISLNGGSWEGMSWYDDVIVRSAGLDPTLPDAHLDYDQDGLTNLEEYQNGTSPIVPNND